MRFELFSPKLEHVYAAYTARSKKEKPDFTYASQRESEAVHQPRATMAAVIEKNRRESQKMLDSATESRVPGKNGLLGHYQSFEDKELSQMLNTLREKPSKAPGNRAKRNFYESSGPSSKEASQGFVPKQPQLLFENEGFG